MNRDRASERQRTTSDHAAIALFVAVVRIQSMGFFAAHRYSSLWGSEMIHDPFFDGELTFLRRWMATQRS